MVSLPLLIIVSYSCSSSEPAFVTGDHSHVLKSVSKSPMGSLDVHVAVRDTELCSYLSKLLSFSAGFVGGYFGFRGTGIAGWWLLKVCGGLTIRRLCARG